MPLFSAGGVPDSSVNVGVIAGGVIGGLVGVALVIFLIVILLLVIIKEKANALGILYMLLYSMEEKLISCDLGALITIFPITCTWRLN